MCSNNVELLPEVQPVNLTSSVSPSLPDYIPELTVKKKRSDGEVCRSPTGVGRLVGAEVFLFRTVSPRRRGSGTMSSLNSSKAVGVLPVVKLRRFREAILTFA